MNSLTQKERASYSLLNDKLILKQNHFSLFLKLLPTFQNDADYFIVEECIRYACTAFEKRVLRMKEIS